MIFRSIKSRLVLVVFTFLTLSIVVPTTSSKTRDDCAAAVAIAVAAQVLEMAVCAEHPYSQACRDATREAVEKTLAAVDACPVN